MENDKDGTIRMSTIKRIFKDPVLLATFLLGALLGSLLTAIASLIDSH